VDIAWLACSKLYGFDLILMDLDMPVMGGLQATELLREIGFEKPIIAVSGSTAEAMEQRCLEAGFNQFVGKPYEFSQLCTVLRNYLVADSLCVA
jgi:CheY-like chemotaxis protein